ncbi:ABC transporter permease [Termitidicoccus mucosus]|uniref:Transport permease protein n=1 Tax=Termitidicoccus mucosus TaxID=1184151 RepID=A0A178IC51_9BACT|nr:ABC transporter permease [Opitutaceae bacterium TSB47]
MSLAKSAPAEIRIRPNQNWLGLDWQSLLHYRDLLYLLVRRDFVSKYKQTVLGPLWFIINPLITTVVFTLVFGRMIGITTDGINPILFYLCGLVPWTYFSNVLNSTSHTFTGNAHLFGKVYFPRVIVPFALSISHLFTLAIQLCTFLAVYVIYKLTGRADHLAPGPLLALVPVFILNMGLLGVGTGMLFSGLTAKYRDFHHLSGFVVQLWMYATPVIYPLSKLLEKLPADWQWLALLNPMTLVTDGFRLALMGAGTFAPVGYAISFGVSLLVFLAGLFLFQRTARTVVDTV